MRINHKKSLLVMVKFFLVLIIMLMGSLDRGLLYSQNYPWPVQPFNQSQWITGTFCEYRSTSASGHFHNGTDIPKADGTPVYPVRNGIVTSISSVGTDAYVRVQDKAYVHIMPNSSLSIGDSVYASQTILGTILSGQGHVHFTNGYVGGEVNSMLYDNSLTPLIDTWAPIIRFVRFFQNNSLSEFTNGQVCGLVDIVVKVDEQNDGPGGPSSVLNNGTYKIGYKILSADSDSTIYEPPNGGWRFQFNSKPNNNYVNIVYFRTLSSTTSHVYQVTNNIGTDNYWDTRGLPEGDYVVMVFTEDTRQNADTAYVTVEVVASDISPPAQPVFKYIKGTDSDMRLAWYPNTDSDLLGYRLYFSFDNLTWTLFKDENILTAAVTDTILNQVLNTAVYFRLTAVDNAPIRNESVTSDIYGMSNGADFLDRVLIVDGFDRFGANWPYPYHFFSYTFGTAVIENHYSFDTVPNEAITDSIIDLNDYHTVFWISGDESIEDESFNPMEQALIKDYLENGGNLFVNGSQIARDLDLDANPYATVEDDLFLHEYLKADYLTREINGHSVSGIDNSIFQGMSLSFGQSPYLIDSVDVIEPPTGNEVTPCLEYGTNRFAGIQYRGPFGNSSHNGGIVYCTFPFETITDAQNRIDFAERILNYFYEITSIPKKQENLFPQEYALLPNYPNPFNPSTIFTFTIPTPSKVELLVFNLLGQRICTVVQGNYESGIHQVNWDGRNDAGKLVGSGIYLARFSAQGKHSSRSYHRTFKLLLTK
jgi:murein DD-endopeptidase MepM/ murein hydrolase activator NlpD